MLRCWNVELFAVYMIWRVPGIPPLKGWHPPSLRSSPLWRGQGGCSYPRHRRANTRFAPTRHTDDWPLNSDLTIHYDLSYCGIRDKILRTGFKENVAFDGMRNVSGIISVRKNKLKVWAPFIHRYDQHFLLAGGQTVITIRTLVFMSWKWLMIEWFKQLSQ